MVPGRAPAVLARGPWEAAQVEARWREQAFVPDAPAAAAADAAVAELRERGSPTHDGMSARLAAFDSSAGRLRLELEPARWSLRLGEDAGGSISALCVVRDADGRWRAVTLVLRRNDAGGWQVIDLRRVHGSFATSP